MQSIHANLSIYGMLDLFQNEQTKIDDTFKPYKMKNILFVLSIGFSSIAAFGNWVHAQYSFKSDTSYVAKNFKSIIRQMAALESPAKMGDYMEDSKNLNVKAIKDFHDRYAHVENTLWYSALNGFEAYFVENGYGDRVFYDKKGNWQYSIISYDENKLPKDLRAAVRSSYYDLAITQVEEYQNIDGVVYIIILQDKSNIKILEINQAEEITILKELNKK